MVNNDFLKKINFTLKSLFKEQSVIKKYFRKILILILNLMKKDLKFKKLQLLSKNKSRNKI